MRRSTGLMLLTALAACNSAKDEDLGTTIEVNPGDGDVIGGVDGQTGEMKINIPGFQGSIKMPKIKLDSGNFDLNGVHLYPGSTIDKVSVVGGGKKSDGRDRSRVRINFTSPAAPETVTEWFAPKLKTAGYTMQQSETTLAGTDANGKPVRIAMVSAGPDTTRGVAEIGN